MDIAALDALDTRLDELEAAERDAARWRCYLTGFSETIAEDVTAAIDRRIDEQKYLASLLIPKHQ